MLSDCPYVIAVGCWASKYELVIVQCSICLIYFPESLASHLPASLPPVKRAVMDYKRNNRVFIFILIGGFCTESWLRFSNKDRMLGRDWRLQEPQQRSPPPGAADDDGVPWWRSSWSLGSWSWSGYRSAAVVTQTFNNNILYRSNSNYTFKNLSSWFSRENRI